MKLRAVRRAGRVEQLTMTGSGDDDTVFLTRLFKAILIGDPLKRQRDHGVLLARSA